MRENDPDPNFKGSQWMIDVVADDGADKSQSMDYESFRLIPKTNLYH
jgi:hypothetical protein